MDDQILHSRSGEAREPLTRDRIVQVALDLLDEVGLDKLSTRRIADELGIKNASLYWHFKNKDELLDAMASRLYFLALPEPHLEAADFDWVEWVADGARAIRRTALSTRDGARLMAKARKHNPESIAVINRNISLLADHGLSAEASLATLQTFRRFSVGSALQEQAEAGRPATFEGLVGDDLFEFGLKMIIDGVRREGTASKS